MPDLCYARLVFPRAVYDAHCDKIDELMPDSDWPEGDDDDEMTEYINPESHGTFELEQKLDEYGRQVTAAGGVFAYHAEYGEGTNHGSCETISMTVDGDYLAFTGEPLQLTYSWLENERLIVEHLKWLRAKSQFDELCGRKAQWTDDLEYIHNAEKCQGCPRCGDHSIDGEGVDIQALRAIQVCSCNNCGHVWTDIWRRSGVVHDQ